jgi:Flp pilus assembly protein TadB
MNRRRSPVIDMRIDGSFPPPRGTSLPMKIAGIALAIATLAGVLALAALVVWLVLWVALILVPVALLAGFVAWVAYRYQAWRRGGSFRSPRNVYRRR